MKPEKNSLPFTNQNIFRLLIIIIIVLSLLAGYYQSAYSNLQKKYQVLEQKVSNKQ